MDRSILVSAALAVVLSGYGSMAAAQSSTPAPAQTLRSLTLTFSDGRALPHMLRARGGSWTPLFPRRPDAPPYRGLPLAALKIDHTTADGTTRVVVSLLYGHPHQEEVLVASVHVTGDAPVTIAELSAHGVDPITLGIEEMAADLLVIPAVTSPSSALEVVVEPASDGGPVYHVSVHNTSERKVMAVGFRAHAAGRGPISSRRKNLDWLPLIEPGGTLRFEFTAPLGKSESGVFAPSAIEHFDVTGVLWDDGVVEGDPDLAASELALAVGQARLLRQALVVLQAQPASRTLKALRSDLQALPIRIDARDARDLQRSIPHVSASDVSQMQSLVELGSQQAKNALLAHIDEALRGVPADEDPPAAAWTREALPRYTAWLSRLGDGYGRAVK